MSDLASEIMVTRQRLLEAAGEVFAEKGFHDGTVRDICARADANVAAVKYHFGGKNELYSAAVHYAHACARVPVEQVMATDAPPIERLRSFVRAFLGGILNPGKPAWHDKLMAREISEPTGVLDEIVAQSMRPRYQALTAIVRAIGGEHMPADVVQLCVNSVVGQMLFYHFAKPVLARLQPEAKFDFTAVETLTEHITICAAGAIKARADQSNQGKTP